MFKIFRYATIAIFLLTTASSNSQQLSPTSNGVLNIYSLGTCPLVSDEVIQDCRVAYRTLGTLAKDKNNVMLIPTWLGGNSEDFIKSGYVGRGKMADTDKYYVIIVEAFGSGNSSSPSNIETQHNGAFPELSITDMVDAQHQLLINHLGIDHVSAVVGICLGASQK
jgi:homoserine O-acetyltransferase